MRIYIIVLLVVVILFGSSVIYKETKQSALTHFPIHKLNNERTTDIYLILYFSMNNCLPCLEIIETLNQLRENCEVIGLVPEEELLVESDLREITEAEFELRSLEKFKKFLPNYAPSLFGVDRKGKVFFVLPGVPGGNIYFRQFLDSFMHRAKSLI